MHFGPVFVRLVFATLGALPILALAHPAAADDARELGRPFGSQGQVVLDDLLGVGSRPISSVTSSQPGISIGGLFNYSRSVYEAQTTPLMGTAFEGFSFAPTFDVFVAPHLSIGVEGGVGWVQEFQAGPSGGHAVTLEGGAMARVGYAVRLGDRFAVWPRVALGGGGSRTTATPVCQPGPSMPVCSGFFSPGRSWAAIGALELPLVLRLHRVVYATIEPDLTISHSETTTGAVGFPGTSHSVGTWVRMGGFVGAGVVL